MTDTFPSPTRRGVIARAILAAGGAGALITASGHAASAQTPGAAVALTGHEHDWDWLVGRWSVQHRRLKGRLIGSTEWEEFTGTSVLWLTLGGLGTVDDNVLELPAGTYRAVTLRAYDAKSDQWSIWWLDARDPTRLEPPVRGGFKDGGGIFMGDDVLRDKPIKVRFQWLKIATNAPRWEQAFSPDGGVTWETNWTMDLTRTHA